MKTLLMIVTVVLVLGATSISYVLRSMRPEHSRSPQKSQKETGSEFQINGRAINAAGESVVGAKVFVESDGSKPRVSMAVSNKDGYFSITLRELGNYTVYGSKEEDGYPLTVSGFHKQVPLHQIPKLQITEPKTIENVVLQLGQSAAKIEGTVKDALTDKALRRATITLRRADNPDLLYSTSTEGGKPGRFKIVVPTEPFTITVESVGYDSWNYGDDGVLARAPSSMKLKRGEVRKLEVSLRKAGN